MNAARRTRPATTGRAPSHSLSPAYDAQVRAADALRRNGAHGEALRAFHALSQCHPDRPDAHSNLAGMLQATGHPMLALQAITRALELDPSSVAALRNSAEILKDFGEWQSALDTYDAALALQPDAPVLRFARGLQLLMLGRWRDGWHEHEQRWMVPDMPLGTSRLRSPRWDGSALHDRHLILDLEQGFGDQLMFVRFARDVAARGGHVTIRCAAPLVPLVAAMRGVASVISATDAVPAHDVHASMMSLPHLLGIDSPESLDGAAYLRPVGDCPPAICSALGPGAPRVGLVWSGNPRHRNDARRSIAPALLQPLVQIGGVRFTSLQRHDGSVHMPPAWRGTVHDLGGALTSFNDTAHALVHLDLLVTVDTAVAHLAGALGVPTLLLVPFVPDWRWMVDRTDTPWYDSVQLLRQATLFDWQPVIAAACRHVERLTAPTR